MYAIPELIIIDISLKNKPVIFGSSFRLIIMVSIKVNELNDSFFRLNSKKLTIYAVNYNVFRIMSGMGSLLFSA